MAWIGKHDKARPKPLTKYWWEGWPGYEGKVYLRYCAGCRSRFMPASAPQVFCAPNCRTKRGLANKVAAAPVAPVVAKKRPAYAPYTCCLPKSRRVTVGAKSIAVFDEGDFPVHLTRDQWEQVASYNEGAREEREGFMLRWHAYPRPG